jgi:hypothetical protein
MDNRTVLLRVDGWSNTRFGRVEGNLVVFEVMWWGCACSTCLGRLAAVKSRMESAEIRWAVQDVVIPERGTAPSVVLVVEPEEMPEKADAFLSDLLGLQISEVAPVLAGSNN